MPGGKASITEIRRGDPVSTGFADVAGMETLKKLLRMQIIEPFRNPGLFQRFRKKAGAACSCTAPRLRQDPYRTRDRWRMQGAFPVCWHQRRAEHVDRRE